MSNWNSSVCLLSLSLTCCEFKPNFGYVQSTVIKWLFYDCDVKVYRSTLLLCVHVRYCERAPVCVSIDQLRENDAYGEIQKLRCASFIYCVFRHIAQEFK